MHQDSIDLAFEIPGDIWVLDRIRRGSQGGSAVRPNFLKTWANFAFQRGGPSCVGKLPLSYTAGCRRARGGPECPPSSKKWFASWGENRCSAESSGRRQISRSPCVDGYRSWRSR